MNLKIWLWGGADQLPFMTKLPCLCSVVLNTLQPSSSDSLIFQLKHENASVSGNIMKNNNNAILLITSLKLKS